MNWKVKYFSLNCAFSELFFFFNVLVGALLFSFMCLAGTSVFAVGLYFKGGAAMFPLFLLGRIMFG